MLFEQTVEKYEVLIPGEKIKKQLVYFPKKNINKSDNNLYLHN